MAVKIGLVLGVLAVLTVCQRPVWSSDLALWGAAVSFNATSPRPAFNYGLALRKAGRHREAVVWFIRAADRAMVAKYREADYRRAVAAQLFAIEMTGDYVCDMPHVQPHCYP